MNDSQIAQYCDDVKTTALSNFYKIQNQRKELEILNKKCEQQQAEIERLNDLLKRHKRHTDRIRMINTETAKKIKIEAGKKVFEATINKVLSIRDHYVNIDGEFVEVESPELLDELEYLFGMEFCEFNEDYEDNLENLVKEMVGKDNG